MLRGLWGESEERSGVVPADRPREARALGARGSQKTDCLLLAEAGMIHPRISAVSADYAAVSSTMRQPRSSGNTLETCEGAGPA